MLREFRVDEKYLRVETEELLHTREAFAHADVEKINCLAAEYTDIPESTLRSLYDIDGKDVLFFTGHSRRATRQLGTVASQSVVDCSSEIRSRNIRIQEEYERKPVPILRLPYA